MAVLLVMSLALAIAGVVASVSFRRNSQTYIDRYLATGDYEYATTFKLHLLLVVATWLVAGIILAAALTTGR